MKVSFMHTAAAVALAVPLVGAALRPATPESAATTPAIDVPLASAPVIDGTVTENEWRDAAPVEIVVDEGWTVHVRLMHDGKALHVAFTGLVRDGVEMYPEVVIGTVAEGEPAWQSTDHWFHASYRDCDSTGRPNDYTTCAATRPGWSANNFPLADGAGIEMSIGLERIGLGQAAGRTIRLAVNVTDTRERWLFWPAGASLDSTAGWATARLE